MSAPSAVQNPPSAPPTPFTFDPIEDAIDAIARGEFVVVMDDESRENEGDLVCAASKVTVEGMAWMIRATSGFICISMPPERLQELQLPPLLPASGTSQDPKGTAYHLTIDTNPCPPSSSSSSSSSAPSFRGFPSSASQPPPLVPNGTSSHEAENPTHPVSTGISAHDRAYTARLLADGAGPEHFTRPGHMVPLRYTRGGVRNRRGHTECAVDLCYLADLPPAGLLCELVHPTDPLGSMARRDDCWRFAKQWGLKIVSVEGLAEYINGEKGARVPKA